MPGFDFALDSVKIRWEEPYVSEALNKKLNALPSGVYRGCLCAAEAVPSKSFQFAPDPLGLGVFVDSMFIWSDLSNGIAISVVDATTHLIDMTSRFTGPGGTIPANETWHVYAYATYTLGSPSSARVEVSLAAPSVGAIKLCKVNMLAGDTTVVQARFDYSDITTPIPLSKKNNSGYVFGDHVFGFMSGAHLYRLPTNNEKEALGASPTALSVSNPVVSKADTLDKYFASPAEVAVTPTAGQPRFQLSGWYYVGKGFLGTANYYFELHKGTTVPDEWEALVGSDGHLISVDSVRIDAGGVPGAEVFPSVHADANGFIQNPWIEGNFTKTVDTGFTSSQIYVWCSTRAQYSSLDAGPMARARKLNRKHADTVMAGAAAGTPTALASGDVGQQLIALLAAVNASIRTIHPTASPTGWVLLWRSHGVTSDAGVTKSVSSLYFGPDGFALITGGYINTATGAVHAGTGTTSWHVTMLRSKTGTSGGLLVLVKDSIASPASWNIDTGWDSSVEFSPSIVEAESTIVPVRGMVWMTGAYPDAFNMFYTGPTGPTEYNKVDSTANVFGGSRFRRYYSQTGMRLCSNCFINSSGQFEADTDAADAYMVQLDDDGFRIYRKFYTEIDVGVPWTSWTTSWSWRGSGLEGYTCPMVSGEGYEKVIFAGSYRMYDVYTGHTAMHVGIQYRARWGTAPSGLTFVIEGESDHGTGGDFTASGSSHTFNTTPGMENWGSEIYLYSASATWAEGDFVYAWGYVTVTL